MLTSCLPNGEVIMGTPTTASNKASDLNQLHCQVLKVDYFVEVAWLNQFIGTKELVRLAKADRKSSHAKYLFRIVD